jgi:hypothetical protein
LGKASYSKLRDDYRKSASTSQKPPDNSLIVLKCQDEAFCIGDVLQVKTFALLL